VYVSFIGYTVAVAFAVRQVPTSPQYPVAQAPQLTRSSQPLFQSPQTLAGLKSVQAFMQVCARLSEAHARTTPVASAVWIVLLNIVLNPSLGARMALSSSLGLTVRGPCGCRNIRAHRPPMRARR